MMGVGGDIDDWQCRYGRLYSPDKWINETEAASYLHLKGVSHEN